jgi:hypothetical protein
VKLLEIIYFTVIYRQTRCRRYHGK